MTNTSKTAKIIKGDITTITLPKCQCAVNNVQKIAKFWRFSGSGGQGLEKVSIFTAKGTSMRGSTSFAIFRVKIGWGGRDLQVGWGKIKKVTNIVYFTYLPRSPCCSDRHQIWGRHPGRDQLCQISFQSVQGF